MHCSVLQGLNFKVLQKVCRDTQPLLFLTPHWPVCSHLSASATSWSVHLRHCYHRPINSINTHKWLFPFISWVSLLNHVQILHLDLNSTFQICRFSASRSSGDRKCQNTSACKRSDQTGTHFKEVHGVWSLTWGEKRGNTRQWSREGGAKLRHIVGWACKVNAQPGSVEARGGAGPLRSGRAGFKAHCFNDVIYRLQHRRTVC